MTTVEFIGLNDDNREAVRDLESQTDVEEICQGCRKPISIDDLKTAVYWPWEKSRAGHKACFEAANHERKTHV